MERNNPQAVHQHFTTRNNNPRHRRPRGLVVLMPGKLFYCQAIVTTEVRGLVCWPFVSVWEAHDNSCRDGARPPRQSKRRPEGTIPSGRRTERSAAGEGALRPFVADDVRTIGCEIVHAPDGTQRAQHQQGMAD